jgi:hypothetical protein
MFHSGSCLPRVSTRGVSAPARCALGAAALGAALPGVAAMLVAMVFLISPRATFAQHGGGGGGGRGMLGSGTGVDAGRPGGVSEKDDLKNFHQAMAVAATAEQRAAFAKISQYAQAAIDQLQAFRDSLHKLPAPSPLPDRATAVDRAIEQARASNQNFLTSFSSAQKSGLKDITGKLSKTDSEVDKQIKTLDQVVQTAKPESEQIASSAASLDKEFSSFQSEQLALGKEMGILLPADGQELAFDLPAVSSSINIAGQPVSLAVSGAVSRTSSENGSNTFSLKLTADLSDLQQNITGILRSELTRSPRCGERIEIQEATLTPLPPASLVVAHLHYEHWICRPGANPTELAGGDGEIEITLTPSLEPSARLRLVSEISRVDADRFLRDLLRSGDLGETLRDRIAASVLPAMQKGADLKAALPPVAENSATLQKAQFQNAGAGQLSLVLDGQLQFSDDQTKLFAAQLKQRLSAQQTSPP